MILLVYSFYLYLGHISFFSIIIPLVLGFIRKKELKKSDLVLFYLTLFSTLIETILFILRTLHIHNLIFLRIFTVFQFLFLSVFEFL